MFKIAKNRRVTWPVVIPVPQNGGSVQKQQIEVEFDVLDQVRLDDLLAGAQGADQDAAVLRAVLVGWSGVGGEDGEALAFGDAARDDLIAIPYVRLALIKAYFEAASGSAAARKN